jgi:type I restriction-modification system DNA methylase subunit
MKMWDHLAEGGQMAVIMSKHWQFASDKASKDFRSFVESIDHDITDLPAGSFKDSGTNVESLMLVLWKH